MPAISGNAAVDVEFDFPFGFKELEGIHSRTDYDLKQHQEFSGKKLQYFDPELNENYIPYVVETSIGLDRMFLAIVSNGLIDETITDEEGKESTRVVLSIPPALSPIKVAILPLTKKDGLPEQAKKIYSELSKEFNCYYEEKDSIGKRYRRQDAIGTPYAITIDHQTIEDETVTVRERDSMEQERVTISALKETVMKRVDLGNLL